MRRKLYIINNGLKDLRGHYFETSISIAEASRSLGLFPVLAAHVACRSDIVPDGLEFHRAFTTDHWMPHPPPPRPDSGGLRGELAALAANSIDDLIDGRIGFAAYFTARFLPEVVGQIAEAQPLGPGPPAFTDRSVRIDRLAKAVFPPLVWQIFPPSKRALRQLTPPFLWNGLKALAAGLLHPRKESRLPASDRLRDSLRNAGAPHEHQYAARFREDLDRLLALTGCSANDHVFLPTAHGRELCAILELLAALPSRSRPKFHLEFRHALALAGDGISWEESPYCAAHAAFFEYARFFPASEHCRFYTDSDDLSQEYERISGLEFGVLPIPFRARLLGSRSHRAGTLCIGFFGDVRHEKGFHWLPGLVEALRNEGTHSRQVRFVIQASLAHPEQEPQCTAALAELKRYPDEFVRLVGLDGPLSPDRYYQLFTQTDLLVCPYHPAAYRNRTSGTMAEAIAAGIPTVVPAGSWLARQQPPGSGKTFGDCATFIEAVRIVCDDYSSFHSAARAGQHAWQARHSPEQVVRTLLGASVPQSCREELVA
jgi:hypothetical protein